MFLCVFFKEINRKRHTKRIELNNILFSFFIFSEKEIENQSQEERNGFVFLCL